MFFEEEKLALVKVQTKLLSHLFYSASAIPPNAALRLEIKYIISFNQALKRFACDR